MKIIKFISMNTNYSRRKIFELIKTEQVYCNNKTVTSMTAICNPEKDKVKVSGKLIVRHSQNLYYQFYKPYNVISTFDDPRNRKCLSDFMHKLKIPLFPVGRLDRKVRATLIYK